MATNNIKFSIVSDHGYPHRFKETPEHLKLKDLLLAFHFNSDFSITLKQDKIPCNYWYEGPGPYPPGCGDIGEPGPASCDGGNRSLIPDTRPFYDSNKLSSQITIICSDRVIRKMDLIKNSVSKFVRTAGPRGNVYSNLGFMNLRLRKRVEFGVYKREMFDELYESYRKADNTITELQFASFGVVPGANDETKYNTKIVEVKPVDYSRPALTYIQVDKFFPSNQSEIVITIYNVDLAANMTALQELLTLIQ